MSRLREMRRGGEKRSRLNCCSWCLGVCCVGVPFVIAAFVESCFSVSCCLGCLLLFYHCCSVVSVAALAFLPLLLCCCSLLPTWRFPVSCCFCSLFALTTWMCFHFRVSIWRSSISNCWATMVFLVSTCCVLGYRRCCLLVHGVVSSSFVIRLRPVVRSTSTGLIWSSVSYATAWLLSDLFPCPRFLRMVLAKIGGSVV